MKTIFIYLLTAITLIGLMNACGPSEEELQRKRVQARQDSLERVRQQQLQQQRMDSIARQQAISDSIEAAKKRAEAERQRIEFEPNGSFALQVEAWRSEIKAQEQVDKWKQRGFENAYVVKHGNEEKGDIWFRVRLGRLATLEMANRLGQKIREEYNEPYWVAEVKDEETAQTGSTE